MKKSIATPSRTKEILEQYGLKAKKGFGQNFLVDPVIVERCAMEAHLEGSVIEIGPGIGSLSEQLCKIAKHVTAYEIDEDLIPVLTNELKEYTNFELLCEDFLEANIEEKVKELKDKYGQVVVCANLPYYITSPVLFRLFSCKDISYITVMVQKEVGDRFAAKVNDKEYSALSVEGQLLYDIKKLFTVPGRSFNPSPNVDSVIIQFSRKDKIIEEDIEDLYNFIRACFKQRRKTIYNNLKDYREDVDIKEILKEAGIAEGKRAQELSVQEIEELYRRMHER
ncbi:MAG: ribosomal RNA small subunit methyltransferase A [Solobacterium sp.]|nr:ribosomal RNA small subunit methyltransferase A [Solobacterium sp.]